MATINSRMVTIRKDASTTRRQVGIRVKRMPSTHPASSPQAKAVTSR